MAANYHWRCMAHGIFEGPKPGRCAHGCGQGMVEMVWLEAPGTIGDKTKTTDHYKKKLANQFGMSDVQSRAGRPAMPDTYRWNDPSVIGQQPKPYSVPVDPKMDVSAIAGAQGLHSEGDSAFTSMKNQGNVKFQYEVTHADNRKVTQSDIDSAK